MIGASVDTAQAQAGLKAMARKAANLSPALRAVQGPIRKDMKQHGQKSMGPDGRWPRRARVSRKANRRRPRKTLGRLTTSLKIVTLSRDTLEVESLVPWSAVHQEGGPVGRGAVIPQRVFLWFSDAVLEQIRQSLVKHILVAW